MFDTLWTAWRREPHLTDQEVLRLATLPQDTPALSARAAPGPDAAERRMVEHAAGCHVCRRRASQQRAALDDLSLAACDTLDTFFPTARLERQVAAVMRRLDVGRERGRILPFPTRTAARLGSAVSPRRWIALAAAGGLLLGLVSGQFLSLDGTAARLANHAAWRTASAPAAERPNAPLPSTPDDGEALLVEVDAALTSLRSPELRALDDLTPRTYATFASAQYPGNLGR
ncbi:MAG: hypothetical protein GEU99_06895 [Luteitalea sp.]|nr:hypothetical protein [Luteitalea sp.]